MALALLILAGEGYGDPEDKPWPKAKLAQMVTELADGINIAPGQQMNGHMVDDKAVLERAKQIRTKETADKLEARRSAKAADIKPLETGGKLYNVLDADPPWKFDRQWIGERDNGSARYPTMIVRELAKLPVGDIAARDAVLFIWQFPGSIPETMRLVSAWGFEVVAERVWVNDKIDLGFWTNNHHETLWICTRGNVRPPDEEEPPAVRHRGEARSPLRKTEHLS